MVLYHRLAASLLALVAILVPINHAHAWFDRLVQWSTFEIGPEYRNLILNVKSPNNVDLQAFGIITPGTLYGNLIGGYINYELRVPFSFYGSINSSWIEGAVQAGKGFGKISDHLRDQEVEGRFGRQFTLSDGRACLIPFTGFGAIYLQHKFRNRGYVKMKYDLYYVPVGFLYNFWINDCLFLGVNLKWMTQVLAKLKFVNRKSIQVQGLKNEEAYSVELPINYTFATSQGWYFNFTPFWKGIRIAKTKARSTIFVPFDDDIIPVDITAKVPAQFYNNYGAKLLIGFVF